MSNVKSALLVGVGGQGAILISKIMSNGFMQAGFDVKQSEVHGMAQRGGVHPGPLGRQGLRARVRQG